MDDQFKWDDQTWDRVWEQILSPIERHGIAMAVLRRRQPAAPFEARIARELARRWARHAVFLSILYLLWTAFWGAIGWSALHDYGANAARLPFGCAAVGVVAVACCWAFRRHVVSAQSAAPA